VLRGFREYTFRVGSLFWAPRAALVGGTGRKTRRNRGLLPENPQIAPGLLPLPSLSPAIQPYR